MRQAMKISAFTLFVAWLIAGMPAIAGCKFGMTGGAPSLTNDAGTACYANGAGSSFADVQSTYYWSSTAIEIGADWAWSLDFFSGGVLGLFKTDFVTVWPVRGGSR